MDTRLSAIFARRSVRNFTGEPVSEQDLTALLEAAMAAPSARNARPWHFVAVTDQTRLLRLAEIHPYGRMLAQAGLAIAVCGDKRASEYWIHDTAAATQNILIAASMIGLGAVWLGMWPNPDRESQVMRFLDMPEHVGIMALVAVGHPAEEPEPRTQYDAARVHRDRW